jgi:hypothetical protein
MANAEGEAEEAKPRQRTNLRKTLRCQSKFCRLFRGRSFGLNDEPLRRAASRTLYILVTDEMRAPSWHTRLNCGDGRMYTPRPLPSLQSPIFAWHNPILAWHNHIYNLNAPMQEKRWEVELRGRPDAHSPTPPLPPEPNLCFAQPNRCLAQPHL